MNYILFEKGKIVVSNTQLLVCLDCEDLELGIEQEKLLKSFEGKLIHKDAFKLIWNKDIYFTEDGISTFDRNIFLPFKATSKDFKYPQWDHTLPPLGDDSMPLERTSLSVKFLNIISQCLPQMASSLYQVAIFFHNPTSAMVIQHAQNRELKSFAIVMPVLYGDLDNPVFDKESLTYKLD